MNFTGGGTLGNWRESFRQMVAEDQAQRGCADVEHAVCLIMAEALADVARLEAEVERLTAAVQRAEK